MKTLIFVVFVPLLFITPLLAQPSETTNFNLRSVALGGCDATLDGEGNAPDVYDLSGEENPAASHHNEGYGLPPEWIDKIGGADRISLDQAYRSLTYSGPPSGDENQNWYWIDGFARLLVEKGVTEWFSMKFIFRGGYTTMRKSWATTNAPYPRYRHNYEIWTIDWSDVNMRAATTGATETLPLGEMYMTYHSPVGLSLGAGGGYVFNEFEDWACCGWRIIRKGKITGHELKFGARYTYPDYAEYGALGLNYGMEKGELVDEEDEDYTMYESDESRFGFQAEFGYPEYFRGAFGYESVKWGEEVLTSATDNTPDDLQDNLSRTRFRLKAFGDGLEVPVTLGFRYEKAAVEGEVEDRTNSDVEVNKSDIGFGLSAEPFEGVTFAAEYKTATSSYEYKALEKTGTVKQNGFAVATEVYPAHQFGIRFGFENVSLDPDDDYTYLFGDYVMPYHYTSRYSYYSPVQRYGYVPEIERGNALSGGFVFRLEEDRLNIEISGRYFLTSEPQIYDNKNGKRHEGYIGVTYFLR